MDKRTHGNKPQPYSWYPLTVPWVENRIVSSEVSTAGSKLGLYVPDADVTGQVIFFCLLFQGLGVSSVAVF